MELEYSETAEKFRTHVREFLAENLPAEWRGMGALSPSEQDAFRHEWRSLLAANRMIGITWPTQYGGGGLTLIEHSIMLEEFVRAGVPSLPLPNDSFGVNLLGATLLHWGTEEQKEFFLPRTISGEISWAQGYSEPDAGSDLFNLRTKGTVRGDELVINGQKTWQTAGVTANWLFCIVRTNPDVSPSRGLSFVLVPRDQPGVEVRGIKTMGGQTEFAEVFFTDAATSLDNVVGGLGNGAKVALTLLGYERGAGGVASALAFEYELERLAALARHHQRHHDPDVRRRLARCRVQVHALRCVALQTLSKALNGEAPGSESSIVKLMTAEHHQVVTELAMDILGPEALTPHGPDILESLQPQPRGLDATSSQAWVSDYLNARARTIYGGSSEIQRNTIGERILGLPREPRPATRTSPPLPTEQRPLVPSV